MRLDARARLDRVGSMGPSAIQDQRAAPQIVLTTSPLTT
jgi:hypothetical protein